MTRPNHYAPKGTGPAPTGLVPLLQSRRITDFSRRSARLLGVEKIGAPPVRVELSTAVRASPIRAYVGKPERVEGIAPTGVGSVYAQIRAFRVPNHA